ncbi:SPX domain-domain-containing protein [Yarrowia lipolytica]|nr:SPX domain-domain-containing protein [Yarrowia lipolytica]RDW45124.1 SPX domain-domain-containing protein [Yarrowia lipolytica]RDW50276.1 SPX domain-domain-containing protein [Yarrowia lipolytica]
MKFAKKLQQTLEEEDIPQEWRTAAIQYKALKKCITKVVNELEEYGLEKETLEMLLQYHQAQQDKDKLHEEKEETKEIQSSDPAIVYSFEGDLREFVPTITITLDKDKNIPMAAKLSSSTRKKLNRILHSDKSIQVVDRSKSVIKHVDSDEEELEDAADLEMELDNDEASLSDSSAKKGGERRRSAQNISNYLKTRKSSAQPIPVVKTNKDMETRPLMRVNSVGSIDSDRSTFSQSSLIWNGDMSDGIYESDDGFGRRPSYASSVFSQADSRQGSRAGSMYNFESVSSRPTSIKNYESSATVGDSRRPKDVPQFQERFTLAVPTYNGSNRILAASPTSPTTNTSGSSLHISPGTSPTATTKSPPAAVSPGTSPTHTIHQIQSMVEPTPTPAPKPRSQSFASTAPSVATTTPISPRLMYTEDGPKMVIQLQSDSEFFHMLMKELQDLDDLKSSLKKTFEAEVLDLAKEISTVASPGTKKSDMYRWRQIFQLYIEAGIFFSDHEAMAGPTNSVQAKERLQWFWDQLQKQSLVTGFKNKRSRKAFVDFWNLNSELVKNHVYQELNQTAITKILKKFDKQTALTSRQSFPPFIAAGPNGTASLAKTMMYVMSERLLSIVPQIDDYLCPICSSIAVKPIRLSCNHVFCVRCLVKLQRKGEDRCPLCRELNVLEADESNLDEAHLKYLKLYFPKEAKAKQIENEKEITAEQFQNINNAKCVIM